MAETKEQTERLTYLLNQLIVDSGAYDTIELPEEYEEKHRAVRSLMNVRMPGRISEEVLKVQDEFLKSEALEKGIVTLKDIPTVAKQYGSKHPFAGKLSIWQGDITRLEVGAIVNAANSQMLGCFVPCHRCIDNAIHSAAGMQLREECNHVMNQKRIRYGKNYEEPVGSAVITKGYNLPAEYVIHTVGPIVGYRLNDSLRQDLRNCYRSVLECAAEHQIKSVAFCCISTGEFHFPNQEAASIAVETVTAFLKENPDHFDRIIFNVFKDMDRRLYEERLVL